MPRRLVSFGYAISGFVALGYQVTWFRAFIDRFGSTSLTMLVVVTAFLGGIGAGSLAADHVTRGLARWPRLRDPLRAYGAIELLLAAAAAAGMAGWAVPGTLGGPFPYHLQDGIYQLNHGTALAQGAIGIACVFVPCFFMGVTFPLVARTFAGEAAAPSTLYAWNTLGASLAILAAEFLLLPHLGYVRAFHLLLVLNIVLGLVFFAVGSGRRDESPLATRDEPPRHAADMLLAGASLSGFFSGALEGDMFKRLWLLDCTSGAALSFISFWAILAIFAASLVARRSRGPGLAQLRFAPVAACLLYLVTCQVAYPFRDSLTAHTAARFAASHPAGGADFLPAMPLFFFRTSAADLLWFVGLFVFPAYFLSSLILPHLLNRSHGAGRRLGTAYGLNTAGFCLGMLCFVQLAPRVNVFYSLKLFAWSAVILGGAMTFLLTETVTRRRLRLIFFTATALLGIAAVAVPRGFDAKMLDPRNPAAHYPVHDMRSDGARTTYVVDIPAGRSLYFDHFSMSGSSRPDQRYMRLMAHVPLLLEAHPSRALLICFGVGTTASAIAAHDGLAAIDIVDLDDRVFQTAPQFAETNHDVWRDRRVSLIHDDGRAFLRRTDRRYDLVTIEPPPPMDEGVFRLYSSEFYADVRAHLTPDGMMTQWLPAPQMSREAVALTIATFLDAFPHVMLFSGNRETFILLGSLSDIRLDTLVERLADSPRVRTDLEAVDVEGPVALFARFLRGDASLRREFGSARLVSDRRNEFSRLFMDPRDPAVIRYDPTVMLGETGAGELALAGSLRSTVTDLARLVTVVPDFPPSSLESVPATRTDIRYAGRPWRRIDALNLEALRAREASRWEACLAATGQSLALVPEQLNVLALEAEAEGELGRIEAMLETWGRYREFDPVTGRGDYEMALALAWLGREEDALLHLERAAAIEPANALPWLVSGDLLRERRDDARAIACYDRALTLDPTLQRAREGRNAIVAGGVHAVR